MSLTPQILKAAKVNREAVNRLSFSKPVAYVYNPLCYAWKPFSIYAAKYASTRKDVVFLGMNPGPWGMAQTGVPFGEVGMVRDWLGISADVGKPKPEHPKRPIHGFQCSRSEVSGTRLWGLFAEKFETADRFFDRHYVANYCPLVFMEASGRNRTPDKLPSTESNPLYHACDAHLRAVVASLEPEWLIAIGAFSETRASLALAGMPVKISRIIHPSPANPLANRGWDQAVTKKLQDLGVW